MPKSLLYGDLDGKLTLPETTKRFKLSVQEAIIKGFFKTYFVYEWELPNGRNRVCRMIITSVEELLLLQPYHMPCVAPLWLFNRYCSRHETFKSFDWAVATSHAEM